MKSYKLAGTGNDGYTDGSLIEAQFSKSLDLLIDQQTQELIISEDTGHKLRKIK